MNDAAAFVDRVRRALECPVCFELPLPGDDSWVDCENGHATCGNCFKRIHGNACPVCREDPVMLMPRSQPRNDIVDALHDYLPAVCPHADCGTVLPGSVMERHRKLCKHKPVACPRPGCNVVRSWFDMSHLAAPNCYRIEMARTRQEGWDLVFPFSEFLDPESGLTRRAVEARRRLLATTMENNLEEGAGNGETYCRAVAYFEIDPASGDVCFHVIWADRRDNCTETEKNRRVLMAASLYVSHGYWTEAGVTRLNFVDEFFDTGDSARQLVVPHHKVLSWHRQAVRQYGCLRCPNMATAAYEPHIHVNVILP